MKSRKRFVLVIAMVGALFATVIAAAGAQTSDVAYLAAVNGASTDPVAVTAGSETIATDLAYGAPGEGTIVPGGTYDIAFTGGTVDSGAAGIDASAGKAMTIVSGYGLDADTATAYDIDTTQIDAGMAKITVWNATDAAVMVSVNNEPAVSVDPGMGTGSIGYVAGTTVPVDIDGVTTDIDTPEDSYTDVFAVNDGAAPAIAMSVVASMTQLRTDLGLATPPSDVAVPDVVGQAQADAESAITGAGLAVGISQAPDDTVPAGSVVSQDPAAGTMVATGSTVAIVVSTGPDTSTVPVPDVSGQPEGDAKATLESAGFVVTSTQQPSSDVEIGLVISTNPAAGTEVAAGTSVEMIVSSGAEDVVVPDFIGMSIGDATAAAEAAGLTITFEEDANYPDPDGVVISQDPKAGTTVEGGTAVVAQLSPDLGEPWAISTLDPDRIMTVTGVGMLPGSTVRLSIVDTTLEESVAVQNDGTWTARFDLSDVENDTEFMLVEGTAADTSAWEATFKIPAVGESTDQPVEPVEESSGFPVWAWIVIGLALVAIVLLIIRMVTGGSDDETLSETNEA